MQYKTFDRFFPAARGLRSEFDAKFADPYRAHAARFAWDFWHVPREYTVLRTPAFEYFSATLYKRFHRHLVLWGRERLGCHDISPPWLSCYVEGCRQEPHRDLPHGPLAFVYSLTDWRARKFKGGETFLRDGRRAHLIAPEFNRLSVFNPAALHGVRQVRGTLDPRQGRLVIHGWFVNPRPFWYGPLTARQVQAGIGDGLPGILARGFDLGEGFLSLRLRIGKSGATERSQILFHTLQDRKKTELEAFARALKTLRFAPRHSSTELTLPFTLG